jgi:hypothetical protein
VSKTYLNKGLKVFSKGSNPTTFEIGLERFFRVKENTFVLKTRQAARGVVTQGRGISTWSHCFLPTLVTSRPFQMQTTNFSENVGNTSCVRQ